jgi:hypothetical protein
MAKSKEKHPAEYYKSIIRKQSKVIQDLQKKAGRANKTQSKLIERELELAEQFLEEELNDKALANDDTCPNCNVGKVEITTLGPKKLISCTNCAYRKVK